MAASVWRGRITFGLVSIPVRLVKAARRERTRFRRVQRVPAPATEPDDEIEVPEQPQRVVPFSSKPIAGMEPAPPPSSPLQVSRPGEEAVTRVRNAPVERALKGYEVSKSEFVVLEPEEVAALRPRTSTELEITEFVRVEEIDPVYYEVSYYVVPEAGSERAYTLLFAALRESGHAGIGSVAMHGREHVALIRAGRDALVLHTMFYANEVGRPAYRVEGETAGAKELQLARLLVTALEAKFEPEKWKDAYEARLKTLVESRTTVPEAGIPQGENRDGTAAVDIMEALRKSLEKARKPAVSETRPAKLTGSRSRRK
jgi:DNA end-binding protein Ku